MTDERELHPRRGGSGQVRGEPDESVMGRADYDPDYDPSAPVHCELCGAEMHYTASCKLQCHRCGYTRDCSDP